LHRIGPLFLRRQHTLPGSAINAMTIVLFWIYD
jgi:hypothetical protein